ncbi:uncharacterized protein F5Z01DRAFT_617672 [Emericellopsis atlantica]|uniref:ADP-ribose 1''-phosphate phosphatase n=1 Tax=Emericellopsis atlantica TaxID=2614577 RepID=A0A9P8CT89_9HYPO|nr:uncharacterized protein F5Z01DRAFT_617672 [Emericellopsis atlantica]KAG9256576.1 hypothetical protein F5Z01DRAFT_617672 [Emericellopsis atlantica]
MSSNPHFPKIHLLCRQSTDGGAFNAAREKLNLDKSIDITIHNCTLAGLDESVKFDTVVSPANSYGKLDGAFDDAISRAFSPRDDYYALTRAAQRVLYQQWRGYAPPGTCTLVEIPPEFSTRSRNLWGTKSVALCPTMRVPANVRWDREVIYNCIWSLLVTISNHNEANPNHKIGSILMTPLATGVGKVSPQRWAEQCVLAMKHFHQAMEEPEKWSQLDWQDLGTSSLEVERTWLREQKPGEVVGSFGRSSEP